MSKPVIGFTTHTTLFRHPEFALMIGWSVSVTLPEPTVVIGD